MTSITVLPELNFWINQILKNSTITDTSHRIPSNLSSSWREPNSILELLFNETFNPTSDDLLEQSIDKKYIFEYQKCNLLFIQDKKLLSRIQPYRWNANVYAAKSSKFSDMFDMTGSSDNSEQEEQRLLPFDVSEEDRSPNITYKSRTLFTTNYQLVDTDKNLIINTPPPHPIEVPSEDLFSLSESDFQMLDLLYDFKTNNIISLTNIDFESLTELAKLIYIYLDVFVNDSYQYYDQSTPISTTMLSGLYEKHVINMIYLLRSKQYGVIYNDKEIINNQQTNINVDEFMIMKKNHLRVLLTQEQVDSDEIIITDKIPWDRKDFDLFKDGLIMKSDVDYTMNIDFTDPNNIVAKINFITGELSVGESILMIWSYIDPYGISTTDE